MTQNSETHVSATAVQHMATAILEAVGTPSDLAQIVAQSLVAANLAGHDSHGVMRLPSYVGAVREGRVKPAERPVVVARNQATAVVDGCWGWGQPAAQSATTTALALAVEYGLGAVTIRRCNHIGRVGEYVEMLARSQMTGIVLCNAGPAVAPYGGREPRLGTNPFAWAAPTADPERPLLLDFATSVMAIGKLEVALARRSPIKPGALLDAEGQPTTDPADFFAGGALLPFGAYKGYAMSTLVEVLGGALSGAAPSCLPEYDAGNGTMVVALNIAAFQPVAHFIDQTTRFAATIRESLPAEGFDTVLLPGDPETLARRQRDASGIPLPVQTWHALQDLASELGVQV